MLTSFDDYPIHQTSAPIAHTVTSSPDHYDRYFFNGYTADGELFFAAALGVYPNRRVMDAAFSVVAGGKQHVVRASRLAPVERTETRVGPITVEVVEPLQTLRVRVDRNAYGITADLLFRARTAAIEEPRFTRRLEGRVIMDSTRLTQFGRWEGTLDAWGHRVTVEPAHVIGCRDRSWGVRMVGEPEAGAPGMPPQFFWLWAPINFDDVCTHFDVNEDGSGRRWHQNGNVAATTDDRGAASGAPAVEYMAAVDHRITWQPGTRRATSATITLTPHDAPAHVITLEPILTFQMLGIGYLHPQWGHGMWKGEEAVDGESWTVAELDPMDPRHIHVQQLCRARMGARTGTGVLEQLVLGPHTPSGFTSILDPAR